MTIHFERRDRASREDYLRALSYIGLGVWSVVFLIWPPIAFQASLADNTRIGWMAATFIGSVFATVGALTRMDIKVEMPGIILVLVGPIFYCASQAYYASIPDVAAGLGNQRYAITVYAILPVLLLLPRLYSLFVESRRLKRINSRPFLSTPLTAEEEAQPGAGFHVTHPEKAEHRKAGKR